MVEAEIDAADADFVAYPNPATDALTLGGLPFGVTEVVVTDGLGRGVLAKALPAGVARVRLDVSALPEGVYVVRLRGGGGAALRTTRVAVR